MSKSCILLYHTPVYYHYNLSICVTLTTPFRSGCAFLESMWQIFGVKANGINETLLESEGWAIYRQHISPLWWLMWLWVINSACGWNKDLLMWPLKSGFGANGLTYMWRTYHPDISILQGFFLSKWTCISNSRTLGAVLASTLKAHHVFKLYLYLNIFFSFLTLLIQRKVKNSDCCVITVSMSFTVFQGLWSFTVSYIHE